MDQSGTHSWEGSVWDTLRGDEYQYCSRTSDRGHSEKDKDTIEKPLYKGRFKVSSLLYKYILNPEEMKISL